MPQLNAYVSQELLDVLDARVREMNAQPGVRVTRSSLTAAALRTFLLSVCTEISTDKSNEIQTSCIRFVAK